MDSMGVLWDQGVTAWFKLWLHGVGGFVLSAFAAGLLAFGAFIALTAWGGSAISRRRFWCSLTGREVEVEFSVRGIFRSLSGVHSCSAFDGGAAVGCRRRCLDPTFRNQWDAALPIARSAMHRDAGTIPDRS
jgi:hypothetical protein